MDQNQILSSAVSYAVTTQMMTTHRMIQVSKHYFLGSGAHIHYSLLDIRVNITDVSEVLQETEFYPRRR